MKYFNYNGYQGSVNFNGEDHCFHGKIEFISDLVSYEAETVDQLKKEFRLAVNSYLETCKETDIAPKKPFNTRIDKELHEKKPQNGPVT